MILVQADGTRADLIVQQSTETQHVGLNNHRLQEAMSSDSEQGNRIDGIKYWFAR